MANRRCRRVPRAVAASESAMACRSVAGTRSRRPMMLRRTPSSTQCVVSVSRYSWSRRRMALTSAVGRFQFADERAKSVSVWIPRRGAASMTRRAVSAPARWPAERGSPRDVAQRPLPSEIMATCKPGPGEAACSLPWAGAGAKGREAAIGTTCEAAGTARVFSNEMEPMKISNLRRKKNNDRSNPVHETAAQTTLQCKVATQKFLPLALAGRANQSFHVIKVTLQGFASCSCQAILRLGRAALEGFCANDVVRLFQFSRVHTQIAIGCFQKSLEFVERERAIHRKRANDAEADVLVNQAVEIRWGRFARGIAHGLDNGFAVARALHAFLTRSGCLSHMVSLASVMPGYPPTEPDVHDPEAGGHEGIAPG